MSTFTSATFRAAGKPSAASAEPNTAVLVVGWACRSLVTTLGAVLPIFIAETSTNRVVQDGQIDAISFLKPATMYRLKLSSGTL